jgi:hypothetical protein
MAKDFELDELNRIFLKAEALAHQTVNPIRLQAYLNLALAAHQVLAFEEASIDYDPEDEEA